MAGISAASKARGVTNSFFGRTRLTCPAGRTALGARAAFAGRAVASALAVDGERGVGRVLALLRDEIELGLGLLGCTSPAEVSRSHVEPTVPYDPPA